MDFLRFNVSLYNRLAFVTAFDILLLLFIVGCLINWLIGRLVIDSSYNIYK